MTMRHEGKTIIVTGAAGAIGFATAEILAREGAKVMLVDIVADRLEQCTAELKAAGHDVIGHHADCADQAQVEGYANAAMQAWGRIDGFFCNAGIEGVLSPTHTMRPMRLSKQSSSSTAPTAIRPAPPASRPKPVHLSASLPSR